ncbi:uncharacterized protein PV07_08914 [Cladophialophora immunda]|uniref:Metallo-beta-lactamase domain-containing protein n=1 Tax=Cladophialophora immunda TaxID=569365 RepID=A0A0D2CQ76_9EURO|nr:uncharacterized protein PV07_08914 [Cladophialophora immunda]KIW25759.1 hypothetical protein PV07_08914 [Cladophialophora immunda]
MTITNHQPPAESLSKQSSKEIPIIHQGQNLGVYSDPSLPKTDLAQVFPGSTPMAGPKLTTSDDLLICCACGAQYEVDETTGKDECRICEDPRQFVPPTGQAFTTLRKLHEGPYRNVFEPCAHNDTVVEIHTEPKFGIGQGARLIRTPNGNVLWDLIAYLDQDTVDKVCLYSRTHISISMGPSPSKIASDILPFSLTLCFLFNSILFWSEEKRRRKRRAIFFGHAAWFIWMEFDGVGVQITELGGLKFIIISHPHFYTTWADWSSTFDCPVYMTEVDSVWANRKDTPSATLKLLKEPSTELLPGLTSVICGGHFPGSQVLHSLPPNTPVPTLFVADTIFAVQSSHNPDPGKRSDTISYQFLWSIPNFIPLPPEEVLKIWRCLKPLEFKATYGVMAKITNVFERPGQSLSLKARLLQSAKIAVKAMGYADHAIFAEEL